MSEVVARLLDAYGGAADPTKAPAMSAYMKDLFPFFGIPTPQRRAIDRTIRPKGLLTEDEVAAVARACWAIDQREVQYYACDELRRHAKRLTPASLPVLEDLVVTKSWWDTVDALAHTVGTIVRRHPESRQEMDRWLGGDNLWLTRVAILHQLGWRADTDATWLFAACDSRAGHPDFFIRKAIGWALREYSKTNPSAVATYVAARSSTLSGLSRREALKVISRVKESARG